MSEGILIIASVIVATLIAGVVMSQVGVFESTFKATTEGQKDIMLTKKWLLEAKPDSFDITIFQPYPGSIIYDNAASCWFCVNTFSIIINE